MAGDPVPMAGDPVPGDSVPTGWYGHDNLPGAGVGATGPSLDEEAGTVTFRLATAHGAVPEAVQLELDTGVAQPQFAAESGDESPWWRATIPRPPVDRFEYTIRWRRSDGSQFSSPDPHNPRRLPGVFGERSEFRFPEYREPQWLGFAGSPGLTYLASLDDSDEASQMHLGGTLWAPADSGAKEPLPLLVAHDGREFEVFGHISRYLDWLAENDRRLRCRVLLLEPHDRDRSYSASPAYGRRLAQGIIPRARRLAATSGRPVGMGASLGAVAMLAAATSHPGTFAGLLLQSGSFFQDEFDAHESGFRFYQRLVRFASSVEGHASALADVQVTMACGSGEENLANNRLLARRLDKRGVGVDFVENRDAHNYVAWRDCWDPTLGGLLARSWGG